MKKFNVKSAVLVIFLILLCVGAILFSESKTEKKQTLQVVKPEIKTIVQKKVISGNLYP